MGNRFILSRHIQQAPYSVQRIEQRLNEADFDAHHLRAYGFGTGKFGYRQMFQEEQSRSGNQRVKRSIKKAARQQGQRWVQEQQEECGE